MLETGRAVIRQSELINETDIPLTLDNAEKASVGNAIEDISACPDMDFTGNTFRKYEGVCIDIKSTDNVEIKENSFLEGKYLKTENCSAVKDT